MILTFHATRASSTSRSLAIEERPSRCLGCRTGLLAPPLPRHRTNRAEAAGCEEGECAGAKLVSVGESDIAIDDGGVDLIRAAAQEMFERPER